MLEKALAPFPPTEDREIVSGAIRSDVIVALGGPADFGVAGREDEHRFRIDGFK